MTFEEIPAAIAKIMQDLKDIKLILSGLSEPLKNGHKKLEEIDISLRLYSHLRAYYSEIDKYLNIDKMTVNELKASLNISLFRVRRKVGNRSILELNELFEL